MTPTTEINITNKPTPPIDWPKVKIGKQTLEVKWGILAEFILSHWGIDTYEMFRIVGSLKPGQPEVKDPQGNVVVPAVKTTVDPRFTCKLFELFAACVAHNYTMLAQDPPQALYWASVIEDEQWPEVTKAIFASMGKRQAATQKPPVALPGTGAEPAIQ